MSINLTKSSTISLEKIDSSLKNIHVGLGWDAQDSNGNEIDCDVSVFMIDGNNKIPQDGFFVFYNNLKSADGAVIHQGDNRTGEGDGDDEEVHIDLSNVHPDILQMIFVVTIHEAQTNNQNFGMVKNAYIRILNKDNNKELCKYNLNNEFDDVDSVQIARIYKYENEWHFEALAGGYSGGLGALLEIYN